MKFFFRADGNKNIGWGHVMRSLSIASAARNTGAECFFICADDSMKEQISSRGFELFILNSDFSDMNNETDKMIELIKREKPDYIFIDSYYVSNDYFDIINENSDTIYIDDVFAFPYHVNYLINYNIYASEAKYSEIYKDDNLPQLILGPRYAPLRDEFQNLSGNFRDKVGNVLISTGGSDEAGLVLKIINILCNKKHLIDGIKYHFILGSYEPDRQEIYELGKKFDWIELHEKVNNMAEIMTSCDIAVSAAGSTLYELCACGIPTVTYILADNQIDGATEFAKQGLMLNAGDLRSQGFTCEAIINMLDELIMDKDKRHVLSHNMKSIVDGNGAQNIIKQLINV